MCSSTVAPCNSIRENRHQNMLSDWHLLFGCTSSLQCQLLSLFYYQKDTDIVLVCFFVNFNRFHTVFLCLYCWIWTAKCLLGKLKENYHFLFLLLLSVSFKNSKVYLLVKSYQLDSELLRCCFFSIHLTFILIISNYIRNFFMWSYSYKC